MKKMDLKVAINCSQCKTQVMKAVAKLQGIDQLAVDAEKVILTVIGEVDPVRVTKQVRKTGKYVEIISVGPPKKPEISAKENKERLKVFLLPVLNAMFTSPSMALICTIL